MVRSEQYTNESYYRLQCQFGIGIRLSIEGAKSWSPHFGKGGGVRAECRITQNENMRFVLYFEFHYHNCVHWTRTRAAMWIQMVWNVNSKRV